MSKFPWEQTNQKKEAETDIAGNTVPCILPFADGAPIPDLLQKAFSEIPLQETSIPSSEHNFSDQPSAASFPLFSMEIPDISSLDAKKEMPRDATPPFKLEETEGALPSFSFKVPAKSSPNVSVNEMVGDAKVQTISKRTLPVFEMKLPDDVSNVGAPISASAKPGINPTDSLNFSVPGPNLIVPGPFSLPAFPQPVENNSSSQVSLIETSAQLLQYAAIPGSDNSFDAAMGTSPFAVDPSSGDIFSASRDPFAQSSAPSPGSVTTPAEKKTGIVRKMIYISENLVTGISELGNSIVANARNLTKGKSLLEKMERIREGNIQEETVAMQLSAASVYEGEKQTRDDAPTSLSDMFPFGSGPAGSSPFAPPESTDGLYSHAPQFPPADVSDSHDIKLQGDFVKVPPVENPLYEFPEALKLDNDAHSPVVMHNDVTTGLKEDEKDTIEGPVFSVRMQDIQAYKISDHPASIKQESSGNPYKPQKATETTAEMPFSTIAGSSNESASVGPRELDDLRGKLESSTGDVSLIYGMYEQLSGNVADLSDSMTSLQSSSDDVMKATGMKFNNLDERVSKLESQLSGIEQQVAHVESENKSILSSLSSIEQHISELVGSYTALVSGMQESVQETDDRLSVLSGKIASMENVAPRIAIMERSGTETSAAVQDLKGNFVKLATDVLKISASQQHIRDEVTKLSKYAEGELKKIGAQGYKVAGRSIQLAHIMKNSSSIKLCMEWLEFLMELVGRNNLPDILSYYEELGWITEEVRMELMRYAEGIDFYMEKPDWKLNPDDHVKSIWFIENLAGIKVDKNRLSVIDRDIEKVRKGSEIYTI